jgi:sec-independent protein translocase protein TatB
MELSIGEMLLIAVAIVVLFGPDKLPKIARDLGAGVRKMREAMEDVKTEILKETDNPAKEIKKEIEKVKQKIMDFDNTDTQKKMLAKEDPIKINPEEKENYQGPISRKNE